LFVNNSIQFKNSFAIELETLHLDSKKLIFKNFQTSLYNTHRPSMFNHTVYGLIEPDVLLKSKLLKKTFEDIFQLNKLLPKLNYCIPFIVENMTLSCFKKELSLHLCHVDSFSYLWINLELTKMLNLDSFYSQKKIFYLI